MIFVDTSAFFAAADRDDRNHEEAGFALLEAVGRGEDLVTHSFVIVETTALMHRHLGHRVARRFLDELGQFRVVWVDGPLCARAVERYAKSGRAGPSFVDCVSFSLMRAWNIRSFLAFDHHFDEEGFVAYRAGRGG